MSVVLGVTGSVSTSGAGTALSYSGINVPTNTDGVLLGMVSWQAATAPASIGATWAGSTMTLLASQLGGFITGDSVAIFGIRLPASGINNMVITWTNTAICNCCGLFMTGCDVSSDLNAFLNTISTTQLSTASPTINCVGTWNSTDHPGNTSLIHVLTLANQSISGTSGANSFSAPNFVSGHNAYGSYQTPGVHGVNSMTTTLSTTGNSGMVAIEIAPPSVGLPQQQVLLPALHFPASGPIAMARVIPVRPGLPPVTAAPVPQGATLPMMGVG